jgi:hypothetical protein
MADHDVVLMYGENNSFQASPERIAVRQGETIGFALAPGSLTGTIRITFHDRHFFKTGKPEFHDTGVFHSGDGDVTVAAPLAGRTTYHCELLSDDGRVIGHSHERVGGECVPAN